MEIQCTACKMRYRVIDEFIPSGKAVKVKCKSCNSLISIDLKQPNVGAAPPGHDSSVPLKKRIINSIKDLPPVPKVVMEIQNRLSQTNVNMQQVARMIETDPGITSKVLRVANSAQYGASGKTSTIMQACVRLGLRGISEVVMLAGTEKVLSGKLPGYGYDAGELWRHSLAVAYGSKLLANLRDPGLGSAAHSAGLIHDIGRIILDPFIEEQKKPINEYMEKHRKTFLEAEIEHFGFSHAEVAAEVCREWKFPEFMVNAIRWHHNPAASNGDMLSHILHMADHLSLIGGVGYDADDVLNQIQEKTMSFLQLKQADLSDILIKIIESVNKISMN